jgi:hypothetical protein
MIASTPRARHRLAVGSLMLCGLALGQLAHAAGSDPCSRIFHSGFEAGWAPPTGVPLCPMPGRLNDTGITFCGAYPSGNNAICTGAEPVGQDAHYGRDALALAGELGKIGAGNAGFDFSKISRAGALLAAAAELGPGPNDWACTRDNRTGLLWEVKLDAPASPHHHGHRYTWFSSSIGPEGTSETCANTLGGQPCNTHSFAQAVNAAQLCGVDGWRMPTRKELVGIADLGRNSPAIDAGYFPNTPSEEFWSATLAASDPELVVWTVSAQSGWTWIASPMDTLRARLVRGSGTARVASAHCTHAEPASNPSSAYLDHGDGSVTDIRSGLMWKRCVEGQSWNGSGCEGTASDHTWSAALALAEATEYAGHDDWRLPDLKETESLVEECRGAPAINSAVFPNTPNGRVWTASPGADGPLGAWLVYFDLGHTTFDFRDVLGLVRLVRAGE